MIDLEALRDEFAAAALTGMMAHGIHKPPPEETFAAEVADLAYRMADAMLLRRRADCPACGQKLDPARGFIVHESGCTYGWNPDPEGVL